MEAELPATIQEGAEIFGRSSSAADAEQEGAEEIFQLTLVPRRVLLSLDDDPTAHRQRPELPPFCIEKSKDTVFDIHDFQIQLSIAEGFVELDIHTFRGHYGWRHHRQNLLLGEAQLLRHLSLHLGRLRHLRLEHCEKSLLGLSTSRAAMGHAKQVDLRSIPRLFEGDRRVDIARFIGKA